MKSSFKAKIEFELNIFGGESGGSSISWNFESSEPEEEELELEDTELDPKTLKFEEKITLETEEKPEVKPKKTEDSFEPFKVGKNTEIGTDSGDLFESSPSPSSPKIDWENAEFTTYDGVRFLSLEKPEKVEQWHIEEVLNKTEGYEFGSTETYARQRLEEAKKNGTLEQELVILNNSGEDLSESDKNFAEGFDSLYNEASGYTGMKAAADVWANFAASSSIFLGRDTELETVDPKTGYQQGFMNGIIPDGVPLSEQTSLWRQEGNKFIFYDPEKDQEYSVNSKGDRKYLETIPLTKKEETVAQDSLSRGALIASSKLFGDLTYEVFQSEELAKQAQNELKEYNLLKYKLDNKEKYFDLTTLEGIKAYNLTVKDFNERHLEFKTYTESQEFTKLKEEVQKKFKAEIQEVRSENLAGIKNGEAVWKAQSENLREASQIELYTGIEEVIKVGEDAKKEADQLLEDGVISEERHRELTQDIIQRNEVFKEFLDKYKDSEELNRATNEFLREVYENDPEYAIKLAENLRDGKLTEEQRSFLRGGLLKKVKDTVGNEDFQKRMNRATFTMADNEKIAEAFSGRKVTKEEFIKEVLDYANNEEYINDFEHIATQDELIELRNNQSYEFKYKQEHYNLEYYRNNYQTRSTSQESGRTKMSNELQKREFAITNNTEATEAGELDPGMKTRVTEIMNRDGVPYGIALKMAQGMPLSELTAYIEENYAGQATLESLGLKSDLENYEIANGRLISDIELSKARNSGLRSVFTLGDNFFGLQIS